MQRKELVDICVAREGTGDPGCLLSRYRSPITDQRTEWPQFSSLCGGEHLYLLEETLLLFLHTPKTEG